MSEFTQGLMVGLIGSLIGISVALIGDVDEKTECEANLPRDKQCVMTFVEGE